VPVVRGLRSGSVAVDASVLLVEAIAQGMIDKRKSGTANSRILLPSYALGRFCNQPTGLQVETILRFLGIPIAIRHAPVVMEVKPAVADVGLDDFVREQVE